MEISNIIATIALIIALIAIILPYVVDFFKQPELSGRITGLVRSGNMNYPFIDKDGSSKKIEGIGYTVNILITVLNKNFNVKNLDVFIKYEDDAKKYKGTIVTSNEAVLDFNGTKRKLNIPQRMDILAINVLKKEEVNSYFIRFIMDNSLEQPEKVRPIEYIEIVFYDYKNKQVKLPLRLEDIDSKRMLSFDAKYWVDI